MAKVNTEALSKPTADRVGDLHARIVADQSFSRLSHDYDTAYPWYAAMLSEIALAVGSENIEYLKASSSIHGDGPNFLYSVTVLTESLVVVCAGSVAAESEALDHGPVEVLPRKALRSLEVSAGRADPFSTKAWPGTVHVLANYESREVGVVFTVKGQDAANDLLNSLRDNLS